MFKLLALTTVLLAGLVQETSADTDKLDFVSADGLRVRFPLYSKPKYFSLELKKQLDDDTKEIVHHVFNLLADELGAQVAGAEHQLDYVALIRELTQKIAQQKSKRATLFGKAAKIDVKFGKYLAKKYAELLVEGHEQAQLNEMNEVKEDPLKLLEDLQNLTDLLLEIVHHSPTSVYLKWSKGTLGNVRFERVATELMGRLINHNLGGIMESLDVVVGASHRS